MISYTSADFRSHFEKLPRRVQILARKQYQLWKTNPYHPSLKFKKVGAQVWSSRINDGWRAVATPIPGGYLWFWIGSHDEYLRVIRSR